MNRNQKNIESISTGRRYAVLLAGGQGSRFWPLSRTLEPKQFLPLSGPNSLFEETILRLDTLVPAENVYIATSRLYFHHIEQIIRHHGIPSENIICEPDGKNTAPSIAVACRLISLRDPSAEVAVLPCDHLIKDTGIFRNLLNVSFKCCACDRIIVFGITPSRPATGYGYIKESRSTAIPAIKESRGISLTAKEKSLIRGVERFCEKPDLKTAETFLRKGGYYWNSGMFVASVEVFLREFMKYMPELYSAVHCIASAQDLDSAWADIKPAAFDYGVLEKTNYLLMVKAPVDLGWSDLGSWQSWDEMIAKDSNGNNIPEGVIDFGSRNTTVVNDKRLIATLGLDNLVIVDTSDALLVAEKNRSEDVKKVVEVLKNNHRQEHYSHRKVKRPWGSFTVLEHFPGFKIKLVEVNPGHALSLQLPRRRSEHWVIVEGTAEVTRGENVFILQANESTYIPVDCRHRLVNPGKTALKLVEVQTGGYLEEDDIERLHDRYKRK
ncbi:MAG: mannose-1-phosphate guanylyltransferase/mannose-6-phosphate isomerase [Candidatus Omnitrophota bacterium]